MRVASLAGLVGLIVLASTVFAAAQAQVEDSSLAPVADALVAVRAIHAINASDDAGPELTPVKRALRQWAEARISSLPQWGDVAKLERQMNDALSAARLECDDSPDSGQCVDKQEGIPIGLNARGYVSDVKLTRLSLDRYLALETNVGIRCGYDQSLYIYEWIGGRWRLLFEDEQDDYIEKDYRPQYFLSVAASSPPPAPDAVADTPAPPPLVLTLGAPPVCVSNWHGLYTRLWRASRSDPSPKPLIDWVDSLYLGEDPAVADASLTNDDLLIEFKSNSIDGGLLVRPIVRHYLIDKKDKLKRIAPVALSPNDFVDEWLTRGWRETSNWTDAAGEKVALARWHGALHRPAGLIFGEFGGSPKRCRRDPTLWEVSFAFDGGGDKDYRLGWPVYFQVRWMAPYRFTLVRISRSRDPNCDRRDDMPDDLGTLFPLQDHR